MREEVKRLDHCAVAYGRAMAAQVRALAHHESAESLSRERREVYRRAKQVTESARMDLVTAAALAALS